MNETPDIPSTSLMPEAPSTPETPAPIMATVVMPLPGGTEAPPATPLSPPSDATFGQSGPFVPPYVPPTGQTNGQSTGQFRFMRSRNDKRAAGICGAIARELNVESWIVRLVAVIIMFTTGIGFIAYIVAAVLIPLEPEGTVAVARNPQSRFGSWDSKQLVGAGLLGLGGLMFMDRLNIGLNTDFSIPLLLIGGGAFALWSRREKLRKDQ